MKIKNCREKWLQLVLGGVFLMGSIFYAEAEAARIDAYRNILQKGTYTIKYENITPSERVTNRDKMDVFGRAGMSVDKNDYLTNRQKSGIVVSNGDRRYEEVGDGNFNSCCLAIGEGNYFFTKYRKDKGYEYFGNRKNKVVMQSKNFLAEAVSGMSYGDSDMSSLINAMLSAGKKGGYSFVAGGTLSNGLNYEDYKGQHKGRTHIIRYYFRGNELVKIAAADYVRHGNSIDGHKCIIKVSEFTDVADNKLLSLPTGVEDTTKRK